MVRGNWQHRVERAEQRKQQAKREHQRHEDHQLYKQQVWHLKQVLDQVASAAGSSNSDGSAGPFSLTLEIWTDTLPETEGALVLGIDTGATSTSRSQRSYSMESYEVETPSRRNRSASFSESPRTKKLHPNSNRAKATVEKKRGTDHELVLCRPHFFQGKCNKACRHVHYVPPFRTLYQVVGQYCTPLEQASAATMTTKSPHLDVMDMVYHFSLEFSQSENHSHDDDVGTAEQVNDTTRTVQPTLSEFLAESLASRQLVPASIVYVCLNRLLIYDRHRAGLLYNASSLRVALQGGEKTTDNTGWLDPMTGLLAVMLEFLPASAAAMVPLVCVAWRDQVQQHAPNLWLHYLQRHKWPIPDLSVNAVERCRRYRAAFLAHYRALRPVRASARGLAALCLRRPMATRQAAYQDFRTRPLAPAPHNGLAALRVWAPNRLLAAYSMDCTLRLFASIPKSGGGDAQVWCKELISLRVDPYRHTKKRSCFIVSMDLDEESIGCLCHVVSSTVDAEAYVLVVVRREDYLLGVPAEAANTEKVEQPHMAVIDIGEAVINYFLSSDIVEDRLQPLIDFLQDGGNIGDVEILVSPSVVACGSSRFMLEVSISIPLSEEERLQAVDARGDNDDEEIEDMRMLDRKLVLVSASADAIVWVGDSHLPAQPLRPRHEDMSLVGARRQLPGSSRFSCSIAVSNPSLPSILHVSVAADGHVHLPAHVDGSDSMLKFAEDSGWTIGGSCRPMVVMPSFIVAADTLTKVRRDGNVVARKVAVTILPESGCSSQGATTLDLNLCGEAVGIALIDDDHVLILVRLKPCAPGRAVPPDAVDEPDVEPVVRPWFLADDEVADVEIDEETVTEPQDENDGANTVGAEEEETIASESLWASVLHVPSCHLIGNAQWMDGFSLARGSATQIGPEVELSYWRSKRHAPPLVSAKQSTFGVGLGGMGIVMSGADVWNATIPKSASCSGAARVLDLDATGEAAPGPLLSKKKKGNAGRKHAAKKDGFARGMSLRG
jgi:hypothetical protein